MKPRVQGTKQLAALSRDLERAGNPRKIKTAIGKEIRTAVKPIGEEAQKHARQILPHEGGLNEWVAAADMSVEVRTVQRGAGVRLTAKRKTKRGKRSRLQDIDAGTVRHRVWGRNEWVTQSVRPGWFTKPAEDAAPEIQKSLVKVLDDIQRRLKAGT